MKTNENIRQLSTEGPGAGTWSLSVSLTSLMFVGKKNINNGKKGEKNDQRATTRHPKNSVSSLD